MVGEGLAGIGEFHEHYWIEAVVTSSAADERVDDGDDARLTAGRGEFAGGRHETVGNAATDGTETDEDQSHGTDKQRPR